MTPLNLFDDGNVFPLGWRGGSGRRGVLAVWFAIPHDRQVREAYFGDPFQSPRVTRAQMG